MIILERYFIRVFVKSMPSSDINYYGIYLIWCTP
jgi:hypothetical protein